MNGAVGNYETRSVSSPISWLGLKAVYTTDERAIMSTLSIREQTLLHALKALTDGQVAEGESTKGGVPGGSRNNAPPVYTDPEDIPFGPTAEESGRQKRKRPIYALVWTWKRHRVYKTKGAAQKALSWWKKNHDALGWKTTKFDGGYFAVSPTGERRAISLHEYDPISRGRID